MLTGKYRTLHLKNDQLDCVDLLVLNIDTGRYERFHVSLETFYGLWITDTLNSLYPSPSRKGPNKTYYLKSSKPLQMPGGKTTNFVHRWIIGKKLTAEQNEVDHVNGRTYDNRMTNLEPVSRQENMRRYWSKVREALAQQELQYAV